jgi:outer membrane protein OmpA-like peptidoglycan-associated protein
MSGFANPTDSIHQFTLELKNNTEQIDFNDRVNLLYYITDSLGDKNDYQVKIKGYCSSDNKLKKASSFAQERADMVRNTMIDNGFFDYQIISCEGVGGPGVDEDKVWLTFFPRTMKPAEISTYEVELARLSKYVMVTDTLFPGDLKPGKIYVFTKITYPKGKRSFDREALPYVMNIARVLAADTTLKAEVRSYLCCPEINSPDGVDADSKKRELTQNRARQLCGFLVKKGGITPTRLKPVAKGAQDLLVRETDDAAKAKNERIELLISR